MNDPVLIQEDTDTHQESVFKVMEIPVSSDFLGVGLCLIDITQLSI